jgi:branched-chain amino acid transport system permease protein
LIEQILFSGLVLGCVYSLFAVGLVIIYRATTTLNFSQGEFFMLGAYLMFTLASTYNIHYGISVLIAIAVVCIITAILFKIVLEKLIQAPHLGQVLVTVALISVLQGLARILWGSEIRFTPPLFGTGSMTVGNVVVANQELVILFGVVVFTSLFTWIFLKTNAGKIMRAASESMRGASLIGININHFHLTMWIVGAGIAALAGIFVGPLISVMPEMGSAILLKAFAAMTLGGFGSIPGAFLGGILMGLIENLTAFYISSALREISAFAVIIVILLAKPTGIMGVRLK